MSDPSPWREALILAPTANDGAMAANVLRESGIAARVCGDILDVCARIESGCGVVIISEEALTHEGIVSLQEALDKQEKWSDLPIILLTSADVISATALFTKAGNISLLERPFSRLTLTRSTEVALRARYKQYEVRDLLAQLRAAKEEAERANVSKSRFLANMSHEIRTPIGAIMGFIDLIKLEGGLSGESQEYMGVIDRNSQQLLRLIDDILDLSKVEAGKMPMELLTFDLAEFLADVVSVFNYKATDKGLSFKLVLETNIPQTVVSDPVRIRQILSNILGNAVKFTNSGTISLRIRYENPFLEVLVEDSGIGLTSEQRTKLFQPFAQADSSTTRKFGGTGLGLVLSRHLAEALGGNLTLESSTPGKGSVFSIRIKLQPIADSPMVGLESLKLRPGPANGKIDKGALEGLKVLVVEDSADNQTLISLYLRKSGARIEMRSNGKEGVETALTRNFDLILMDLQMPVLDGHEATKILRAKNYSKPIIALTAHAMDEERKKCFASGFTDYLTKPVQRSTLVNVLSRYCDR